MSKLLTIVIPTYNTENYLPKCLDSLIIPKRMKQIEILIVIDGSPDNSVDVAKIYEQKYPNSIKVIEKVNGGHGSTINRGLELASGKYFRVLDSDDWFNKVNFSDFLLKLSNSNEDLVMTHMTEQIIHKNKSIKKSSADIEFDKVYKTDYFDYNNYEIDFFGMSRCTYRTSTLRENNLNLLENIFFEDSYLHVFHLASAKTFVFYDFDLYNYLIGRPGQSVTSDITRNHIMCWQKVIVQIISFRAHIKFTQNKLKFIDKVIHSYISHQYNLIFKLRYFEFKFELKNLNKLLNKYDYLYKFSHPKRTLSSNLPVLLFWIIFKLLSFKYYLKSNFENN